jgi:hypothetical protein
MPPVTVPGCCVSCRSDALQIVLGFGPQPPGNRYLREGECTVDTHDLTLGQCPTCGLVQLVDPMPEEMVRSRYAWIRYSEPEGHLDRLVDDVIRSTALPGHARVVGLTHNDDSTLARFNRLGFGNTYRYDMSADIGIDDATAGLETIQIAMTRERAGQLVHRHGKADLLFVRYVLEHAHDPIAFLGSLAALVNDDGFLVLEVPESTKFLSSFSYSFVWEEHITYLTAKTMRRLVEQAGFEIADIRAYDHPLEDSLTALVRVKSPAARRSSDPVSATELDLAREFGARFASMRERVRHDLDQLKRAGKRIALFGASHLAARFLNFFDLGDIVHCVIDDHPRKAGLRMPGSGVMVRTSSSLLDERIDLCLLSLSPESERKVVTVMREYVDRGGVFRSIFALSPLAYEVIKS